MSWLILFVLGVLTGRIACGDCDVTVYHPVCGYRGYLRTFFSDCLMQLENYGLVDGILERLP